MARVSSAILCSQLLFASAAWLDRVQDALHLDHHEAAHEGIEDFRTSLKWRKSLRQRLISDVELRERTFASHPWLRETYFKKSRKGIFIRKREEDIKVVLDDYLDAQYFIEIEIGNSTTSGKQQ